MEAVPISSLRGWDGTFDKGAPRKVRTGTLVLSTGGVRRLRVGVANSGVEIKAAASFPIQESSGRMLANSAPDLWRPHEHARRPSFRLT